LSDSTKFLHFCGILQKSVLVGGKATNAAYFGLVQVAIEN